MEGNDEENSSYDMCVIFVMSYKNSSGALCTNNPILFLRCQRSNGQLEGQGDINGLLNHAYGEQNHG